MNLTVRHPTDRPNFSIVTISDIQIAFSYETPVGIMLPGEWEWKVRENDWSNTTGKHLNYLDNGDADAKKARLPAEEFNRLLNTLVVDIKQVALSASKKRHEPPRPTTEGEEYARD